MWLECVAVPGKYPYSSNLLDQESRAAACRQGSAAKSTRLLAAVLKDLRCPALIVGGVADHVHILCQLAKTQSVSVVMEHLKTSSSKWLKTQGVRTFSWQRGYGAFSVSQSNVASVVSYIEKQEEHHRTATFEEEFRLFLKRYRVEFDERYVWD